MNETNVRSKTRKERKSKSLIEQKKQCEKFYRDFEKWEKENKDKETDWSVYYGKKIEL